MSDPSPAPEPLSPVERRVLGVLIEKQKTSKTSDAYPMSVNSLTTGCNQKSNRDPVMELGDGDVEDTLLALSKRALVNKIQGGRVEKWRHLLYDHWKVTQVEMAVLAELLLRAPQTEGDLRGRASRMNDIPDLDALRELLTALEARQFVVYLTPRGRGAMVTHGFHLPQELAVLRTQHAGGGPIPEPAVRDHAPRMSAAAPGLEAKLEEAFAEIARLKERVAALEAKE
jgi:uncharacterized protein YceH (UPF0502 family)